MDRTRTGAASSVIVAVSPEPTSLTTRVAGEDLDRTRPATELLILCTGNAARSVMAGFMLDHLKLARPQEVLHIVTAGTLTIDGQPMGLRTRAALSAIPELANAAFGQHRSRQVHEADLERADLVVVMEADHVRFVRRHFPAAAGRTATIRRLCHDLAPPPPSLPERVAALNLADAVLDDGDDVIDPAGGDDAAYAACAAELWSLCQELIPLL
jgi:protein-tyrosine-phosphatase